MKTILIIDDEFALAEALAALLIDEGYQTMTAVNGKQGIAKLDELKPDLVIVDYMMPVMSGVAMLKAMKNDNGFAQIPTILMSGIPEAALRKEVQGYSGFLRKPFDANDLLALVRRLT